MVASADSVSLRYVRSPEGGQRGAGRDGPVEPVVSTRSNPHQLSDAFFVTARSFVRRFPYDSRTALACLFRRPEGVDDLHARAMSSRTSRNRRERSSPSLARRLAKLPNALTPVIVPIPRSAIPRARAPVPPFPEGCGASAFCGGGALANVTRALVRPGFASRHVFPLLFPHARCELFAHNHARSVLCHDPGGPGELGHLSPRGGTSAPLHG
jgi:hypothetical protein